MYRSWHERRGTAPDPQFSANRTYLHGDVVHCSHVADQTRALVPIRYAGSPTAALVATRRLEHHSLWRLCRTGLRSKAYVGARPVDGVDGMQLSTMRKSIQIQGEGVLMGFQPNPALRSTPASRGLEYPGPETLAGPDSKLQQNCARNASARLDRCVRV